MGIIDELIKGTTMVPLDRPITEAKMVDCELICRERGRVYAIHPSMGRLYWDKIWYSVTPQCGNK